MPDLPNTYVEVCTYEQAHGPNDDALSYLSGFTSVRTIRDGQKVCFPDPMHSSSSHAEPQAAIDSAMHHAAEWSLPVVIATPIVARVEAKWKARVAELEKKDKKRREKRDKKK